MIVDYKITVSVDFPEEDIERICNELRVNGWNEYKAKKYIDDVVTCFDDFEYYTWGEKQTQLILEEIKHRIEGTQISMFDTFDN